MHTYVCIDTRMHLIAFVTGKKQAIRMLHTFGPVVVAYCRRICTVFTSCEYMMYT